MKALLTKTARAVFFLTVVCWVFLGNSNSAVAEDHGIAADVRSVTDQERIVQDDPLEGLLAVADSELSVIRGGEGSVLNIQDLEAIVSGNSVEGTITTGDSLIGAGAFSDLDGISSVVINTGNNVSIQNSTVVNIVVED